MVSISARLLEASSVNNWRSTLGAAITNADVAIGLVSTASLNPSHLTVPGVLVIDRINATSSDTPATREYISFTTIALGASGVTIAGVTRALAGSTAQSHNTGAIIEDILSVTHWGDLIDFIEVGHLSDGTHPVMDHVRQVTITGISGASGIKGDVVFVPGSNMSIYAVSGVSGYSWLKVEASAANLPPFNISGSLVSYAYVAPAIIARETMTIRSVSAVLRSPVSSASLVLDLNKNMVSIFTDQNTRLGILGGGTYASTASIGTKALVSGDVLTLDVDNAGGQDLSCLLEV